MGRCLLEEIELFPPRKRQPIRSLLILHSRSELYVGVRDQVIKIPLKRCSYYKNREWVHVHTNTINLNGNRQKQMCTQQSFKAPSFIRWSLSAKAGPVLFVRGLCWDLKPCKSAFVWATGGAHGYPLSVRLTVCHKLSLTHTRNCAFCLTQLCFSCVSVCVYQIYWVSVCLEDRPSGHKYC